MARFSIEAVFKGVDKMTAPVTRMQNKVGKFTRAMRRGLERANRAASKLADKMRTGFRRGAIVLGAAIGVVSLAVKTLADRADNLAKKARILKMPIEELQKFQFVAEQSGVSSDTLTKALGILDKQIGQAKTGTGTLVTILKKSNPQLLKQLTHAKNTADAFKLMNKAIRNTKNPIDRAALSFAAYGRTGLDLVNMANLSTKAFNKLSAEAVKNGLITEKQAEAAEAFNDQLNSLKHTFQGLIQNVLLPLFPMMTKYLQLIQKWTFAHKQLIQVDIKRFIILTGKAIRFLVKHAKTIGIVIVAFVSLIAVLRVFIGVMAVVDAVLDANPIVLIVLGIIALVAAIVLVVRHWKAFKKAVVDVAQHLGIITKINNFLIKGFEAVGSVLSRIFGSILRKIRVVTGFISKILHPFQKGVDVNANINQTGGATGLQMISPQARTATTVSEILKTQKTEVTIKDETGRAQVTGGKLGSGVKLATSGVF